MNQSSVTRLAKIRSQHDSMRKKKKKIQVSWYEAIPIMTS